MTIETISFKVAMDKEQAALKNTHDVTINVDRPDGVPDIIWEHAVANYKVKLQGQIRPNWDKFLADTFPKNLAFGEALYTKAPVVIKTVTVDSAAAFANTGTLLEQLEKKIDLLEKMGIDVPQTMWDKLDKLSPVEDIELAQE